MRIDGGRFDSIVCISVNVNFLLLEFGKVFKSSSKLSKVVMITSSSKS